MLLEDLYRKKQVIFGAIMEVPVRKMYISDLHFGHAILNDAMDCRGFASADEMNEYMIKKWNEKVTDIDEVYILGDFSVIFAKKTNEILDQLKGKLFLIRGNHDKFLMDRKCNLKRFEWIKSYAEIEDNGRSVILSHYPVFCYNGQYRRDKQGNSTAYMLYGHVHNTTDEKLINSFIMATRNERVKTMQGDWMNIPCNMINCFAMFSDYTPLTLDEWIDVDRERRKKCNESMQL